MKRQTIAAFGAFAVALIMSGFGCELITAPDRSLIDAGGTGGQTTGGGGAGATGGGGTGGTAGTGGTTGTKCETPADCPAPPNVCVEATCEGGICGQQTLPDGPQGQQIGGDCKVKQCTSGVLMEVTDDNDLPADGDCTIGVCTQGTPSQMNAPKDTACGAGGLLKCDGNGQCVDCFAAADCGVDDECRTFTCTNGVCDTIDTAQGTPLATQTAGDCHVEQCDGNGSIESVIDNADVPADATTCTDDVCVLGVPSNLPVAINTSCDEPPGILCDGAGSCVQCNVAADCPGVDDECGTRTCVGGTCGKIFAPAGTTVASQTQKDCKKNVCDGAGAITIANDDTDAPDDNNPCTTDTCSMGNKVFTNVPMGTSCGGTQVCDLNGVCQGCVDAATCPGVDDECKTRTCVNNSCGFTFAANGTAVASQTANDCKKNVCDGSGNIVNQSDNADLPADDGNQCTDETCIAGVPAHPAKAANTACSQNGGSFCSAAGQCVACNSAAQCPGTDNECQTRTCVANVCGFNFQPNGTVTPTQVTGDCKVRQCDGAGNFVQTTSNGDVPADDGNQCTDETCIAGVPAHPTKAVDTACSQNGGSFCSAVGTCVQCNGAAQCPGTDTACQTRTCNANTCGFNFQPNGTVIASQTTGDCKENQCDGSGGIVAVNKDTDLPADDGNQCTDEVCTSGVPSHPNKPVDTACSQNGGTVCSAVGTCVGCNTAAQCPGVDNACQTKTCSANTCGFNFQPNGTVIASQTTGDCKENQCDGAGVIVAVNKDTDLPADDGNQCTNEVCTSGVPSHPNKPVDTACSQNGGSVCSAGGTCVGCNTAAQCPGVDNACQTKTCTSNTCGFNFQANGFVIAAQTTGDCQEAQCNGAGGIVSVNKDTDVPADDGNQCTNEICTSGVPSHPNKPVDTACSQNGGSVCSAGGTCVGCNTAAQCPGVDNACQTKTCSSNTCGFLFQPNGFVIAAQTSGDCKENQCDGAGVIVAANKDTDLPADDGNECTNEVCTSGVPSHPNKPVDTACNQNGGSFCTAAGACVECNTGTQCPGTDTACQTRTCSSNTCGFSFQANGFVIAAQTTGDCKENQCNGSGGIVSVNQNADLPVDGLQCTGDVCTAGVPSNPSLPLGTACNQNGGTQCNGVGACVSASCSDTVKNGTESDIDCGGSCSPCSLGKTCNGNADCASNACAGGVCVECLSATACPGVDNACQTRTCNSNTCGFDFQPNGTVIASQTSGDCLENQCNGSGGIVSVNKDTDLPADDGNQCTDEVCTSGVASHPAKAADTTCNQNGGTVCDGASACVQCNAASQCAGADTECQTRTCSSHTCGFNYQPNGFVIASQTSADCLENQCNGSGSIVSVPKDTDLPADDGNQCTDEVCASGVASHPPKAANATCNQNGGSFCDGASACVQCNLAAQCPGSDGQCQTRVCSSNTCGFNFQPQNTACNESGGSFCSGAGACVQCNTNAQCGTSTECATYTCGAGNTCSTNFTASGFVTSSQTSGDCKENQCDGAGVIVAVPKNTDLPADDGLQCTGEACSAGVPQHPPVSVGTVCNQSGGTACDGLGACVLPPSVTATTPANNATGVAVGTTIAVTFSRAMNVATLSAQTDIGTCSGSIQLSRDNFASCLPFSSATPSMNGANTIATLTPAPALSFGIPYQIRVLGTVTDTLGLTMGTTFTTTPGFTTGTDYTSGPSVVISQVYGGGGNSGAQYNRDFIELHNRGPSDVNIGGWAVHWASAGGSTWQIHAIPANTILAAGKYFLIEEAGGATGASLPSPDLTGGSFTIGSASAKIFLTNDSTALTGTCPATAAVMDKVNWGTGANCAEGTAAGATSNTTAVIRKNAGCEDANNNSTDFAISAPTPRSTASAPALVCSVSVNEKNVSTELDFCNLQFPTSLSAQTGTQTALIYAQAYEAGITDPAGAAANLVAQIGYGPKTVNPETQSGWTWTAATFNVNVGNNDEWQAQITAPAVGSYYYTSRFSFDGVQWTYCDLNGAGSNAGLTFEIAQLPTFTVTP